MNRNNQNNGEEEGGSKRKIPVDAVSSSVSIATESACVSERPPKKQATTTLVKSSWAGSSFDVASHEERMRSLAEKQTMSAVKAELQVPFAATAIKPEATTSSSAATVSTNGPTKLILQWTNYDDGGERVHSMSADELIAQGVSLRETRAAKISKCEWEGRHYTLKLVDETQNGPALNFVWWANSSHANLMNFNQMSQDLADFCFTLWCAAGRKRNQYSDFDIEMGSSPHSCVKVNKLIAEASASKCRGKLETTYLDFVDRWEQARVTKEQGRRLVSGLIALIGKKSTFITHGSDLDKLKVGYETDRYRFETLRKGRGRSEWHVRAADCMS